ncbi:MAG: hypothetical protein KatS3mg105_1604 [Gemmatales bacterium]|nr:MAG: hypothetical protein KatS3mg105_1604 [Gemmatales bacterium]
MHDETTNIDQTLLFEAVLYASGELDDSEAQEFEGKLAGDQVAREALAQAVQLSLSVTGEAGCRPSSSWREQARKRLLSSCRRRQRFFAKKSYRGHPVLWCAVGAAAAALLFAFIRPDAPSPPATNTSREKTTTVAKEPAPQTSESLDPSLVIFSPTTEAADYWAELHATDHLEKAHGEQTKRKQRLEEMEKAKIEERGPRPMSILMP